MKHRETHPKYVEGCKPCKWSTVAFGTVPGGARDSRNSVSAINQRHRDLDRYREKRRAGEQPDGTTKKAMDAYDKRVDSWEGASKRLESENPEPVMKKLEQTTFNRAA